METASTLAYYEKQYERRHSKNPEKHSAASWDACAGQWGEDMRRGGSICADSDERLKTVEDFLLQRGALNGKTELIEIGCGPGRFAAKFAQTARHVTASDISPKMLSIAEDYSHGLGLSNLTFVPCDFRTASLSELGWEEQFDLAYASLTPAVAGLEGLEKFTRLSRGWCCNTCFVTCESSLERRVRAELGLDPEHPFWDGTHFHAFWNLLWMQGYLPETVFHTRQTTENVEVTPRLARTYAWRCRDDEELRPKDETQILSFLKRSARNGYI